MSNARNLADVISGLYSLGGGITAGSVGTTELANGSVNADKLAPSAVTEGKLASSAVTSAKRANGAVTAEKMAAGVISYPVTSVNGQTGAVTVSSTKATEAQVFTSSGTWTCPAGVTKVKATVVGGGQGGSINLNFGSGAGGTNGGLAVGVYTVVPGTTYSITVGTGGAAFVGAGFTAGSSGGSSSFASFCSASGGTSSGAGTGTNGTLRNTTSSASTLGILSGASLNTGGAAVWSTSGNLTAGAGGGFNSDSSAAYGGVGGAVLLEWVA